MNKDFLSMFALVTGAIIGYVLCEIMIMVDIKKELKKMNQKLYDIEKKLK